MHDVYCISDRACTGFQKLKGGGIGGWGQIETETCGSKPVRHAEMGIGTCFFTATSRVSFMGALWV